MTPHVTSICSRQPQAQLAFASNWGRTRRIRGDRTSNVTPETLAKRAAEYGPGALSLRLASMNYVTRADGRHPEPLPAPRLFILKRDDARFALEKVARNWANLLQLIQNPSFTPQKKPMLAPKQPTLFDLNEPAASPSHAELQAIRADRDRIFELRRQGESLLNPSYRIPLSMLPKGKRSAIPLESAVAPYGNWHQGAKNMYSQLLNRVLPHHADRPTPLTGRDVDIVESRLADMTAIAEACESGRISTTGLVKGLQATLYFPDLQGFSPLSPEPLTDGRAAAAIENIYVLGRKPR